MRCAIVYWSDTIYTAKDKPPEVCPEMKSIGFITKLKDRIILTHLITPDKNPDSGIYTTIPRGCVKRIKYL